jgi:hypothetical protein
LQPQSQAAPVFLAVWAIGVNEVVLWEPSQKGWVFDSPQAHQ